MDALGLMGALGAISGAGLKVMSSGSAHINVIGGTTITPPSSASMAVVSWPISTNSGMVIGAAIVVKGGTALLFASGTTTYGTATWTSTKLEISNDNGGEYVVNAAFFG